MDKDEDKDKQDIISERLVAYFLTLFSVILGLTLSRIFEAYKIDVSAGITLLEVYKGYIPLFISLGVSGYFIIVGISAVLFKFTRSSEDNNKDTNSRERKYKILIFILTLFAVFLGFSPLLMTRTFLISIGNSFLEENNRAKIIKDLYQLGGLPCEPNQLSILSNIDTILLFILFIIIFIANILLRGSRSLTASMIINLLFITIIIIIYNIPTLTNVKIC